MSHLNFLKCEDGVPVKPHQWTLDHNLMPEEDGVTWEPFDTDVIYPVAILDALVDGKVVQDQSKRNAYDAGVASVNAAEEVIKAKRAELGI